MGKMTSVHIEEALFRYFNPRRNLIVPNVWWGLGFQHEIDLLVCSKQRWCTEIEIKVSLNDIKADLKKAHGHSDERLRRLFFAIPDYLYERAIDYIPERAGILAIKEAKKGTLIVKQRRYCKINKFARQLTNEEYIKLLELGCMRLHNFSKLKLRCKEAL